MNNITRKKIASYVEENIAAFHSRRIDSLTSLKLQKVIKRKNPYLYKAKNMITAPEIVKAILDAYLSSQEEAIFGNWLEGLAIYINSITFNGWKSGIEGIDLEFDHKEVRYIVSIKSGPSWGNSSQILKMKDCFTKAKKTLRTSNSNLQIVAVNGCCYGKDNNPDKGDYFKYCGQKFWEFISGYPNLYIDIIEPLGKNAKDKNESFQRLYSNMINVFTREFTTEYCDTTGNILWEKIVKENSEA